MVCRVGARVWPEKSLLRVAVGIPAPSAISPVVRPARRLRYKSFSYIDIAHPPYFDGIDQGW